MKNSIYLYLLAILFVTACNKKDFITTKDGVRLPPVTGLALEKVSDTLVKLSWTNPGGIPPEIQQPLRIFIEVREILGVTRAITVYSTILENAPTDFTYVLPDITKKYDFTVKMNGTANVTAVNLATEIFSTGQTVSYNQ